MSTASEKRLVIVNADDLGLSAGINRGIFECHENGIVTSASLMVRWPAAKEAAEFASAYPAFSVGLHLDMGEWVYRAEEWQPLYEVLPPDAGQAEHVAEARRQLDHFRALVGREPSHLDSHQHRHRSEPLRSIALEICQELRIPLREIASPASYFGSFYGQSSQGQSHPEWVSPESVISFFGRVPSGISELGCHPASEVDFDSIYAAERLLELRTLCDPLVRAAMEAHGLQLISFRDIPQERMVAAPGTLRALP